MLDKSCRKNKDNVLCCEKKRGEDENTLNENERKSVFKR